VPVGQWKLSVGIGAGVYTNPLYDSKNIPLIIVPSISYYGERVFFQNNTLGYTLLESDSIAISVMSKANVEKAFFTRWHPQNVFIPNLANDFVEANFISKDNVKISPETVKKRRWALDAGVQLNWFVTESINAELQILHDINSVYNGFNANAEISKSLNVTAASFLEVRVGLQWNSSDLVDYYYGIDKSDTAYNTELFEGKSSVNPYISLGYAYKMTADWVFKTYFKRKKLASNTYLSPLVEDHYVDLMFVGFFYEF
jgi:outer membrane protein